MVPESSDGLAGLVRWGAKSVQGDLVSFERVRDSEGRTNLEDLAGVRVDDAVEVERVRVEVLVLAEPSVEERLLETKPLPEAVLVPDRPAVACETRSAPPAQSTAQAV